MAPYYKKSYTLTPPSNAARKHLGLNYIDEKLRGVDGPIQASFPEDLNDPLPNAWIATLKNLGYPMSGDPFSGIAYGGYTNAASIDPKTRQRSYSANAYWEPAQKRSNLRVITGALAEKLLLDASNAEVVAQGAQYSKDGRTNTIKARKEVILCAGAFYTPKLLELSGIGNASLLKTHGIPLVIDNPNVGENLQDQVMTGFSFEVRDGLKIKDDLSRENPAAITAAMESFSNEQSGPFTVGGVFSYAFLPVIDFTTLDGRKELDEVIQRSVYEDKHPLQQAHALFVHDLLANLHEGSGGFFTYPAQGNFGGEGSGAELVQTLLPGNFYTIAVSLMHPLSRGSSHITSSDPNDKPAVDPKYLVHPLDLEIFARHVRFIGTIMQTEPLKSLLKPGGLVNRAAPKDLQSLDAIKEYVKDTGLSSWHPTTTCAMLPRNAGGVVDHRLIVHQTKNLRIVDASVMPITPRGNPQSSVYAIAERAADFIKMDYGMEV